MNCPYCKKGGKIPIREEAVGMLKITNNMLEIQIIIGREKHSVITQINFCPFCGGRLFTLAKEKDNVKKITFPKMSIIEDEENGYAYINPVPKVEEYSIDDKTLKTMRLLADTSHEQNIQIIKALEFATTDEDCEIHYNALRKAMLKALGIEEDA